jgi:DNA mismatch repair protein MutS
MLVGGFYELYDVIDPTTGEPKTSMKRAVEILGIQLKLKKGDAAGQDGLFAGFPKDSLMKYVALLTRENWTVAVLDQVDVVGKQRKDRTLARIYSPGTTEGGNDAVFLGGIWFQEVLGEAPIFSAAAVDLTTGCMTTYSGRATGKQDSWTTDDLVHFFQVHSPKELVVWWDGAAVAMPSELIVRKATGSNSALIHRRAAKALSPLQSESLLRQAFRLKTMLPIATILKAPMNSPQVQAVVALLGFVQDHYMSAVDSVHVPKEWLPESAVFLGNHALTQLNMIAQRPEDSVLGLYLKTATPFGRRAMRERILYPICDPVTLELRYKQVEWALTTDMQPILRQIEDLPRLHHRIRLATTTAADVLLLDKSYERIGALSDLAHGSPLGLSPEMGPYLSAFHSVFSVEKAHVASEDAFCFQNTVAPGVTAIEEEIAAASKAMTDTLEKAIQDLGLTPGSLRLDFKEASVMVTGTKTVMALVAKAVTKGAGLQIINRKASSSLEIPALTALFHKILGLRNKLSVAVKEALPGLCDLLTAHSDILTSVEGWVSTADITATVARVSEANGFCRPSLITGPSASIDIVGLAHPLIENQQTQLEYVRHNVRLDPDTGGWLVYGMNASGKSSLMKAVGIATLLAQAGCYVPATSLRFTPFRAIFTRILNKDDLWAGLSSFAVEMTELNEILRRADKYSLVLGDEVCSGTESDSATALVGAALQWLSEKGAKYIFATHLHGLHSLPIVQALTALKVWHLRVKRDPATDRLIYERTLQPGAGSSLYGLEVAKAMGLPLAFLDTAHRLRKELTGVAAAEDAPVSRWNTAIQRVACEICGAETALEVHHVQQRSEAVRTRLPDGSSMNSTRNLAVVCDACHDAHHAGLIEIGPVQQTSEGPVRSVITTNQSPAASDGVVEHIERILRERPNAPLKRLVYDLEREGIKISEQRLRSMRKGLQPLPAPGPGP